MKRFVKKLGVFGAFGFNRGDDALAVSLVEGFRAIRGDLNFVVPVMKPGLFKDLPYVRTFGLNRRSPLGLYRFVKAIASVDAVIFGAGSMIQDKLGGGYLQGILGYSFMLASSVRLLRKPSVTSPIGVDALERDRSKDIARYILSQPLRLFVRDTMSARIVADLLHADVLQRAVVVCDPVFCWPSRASIREENILVLAPAFEGISERYISLLFSRIAEEWLRRFPESRVCFLAMDERAQEDGGKIGSARNMLPDELRHRTFVKHPLSPEEVTSTLRSARSVVAMRLHALILAYGYTDIFCVSRTTKTDAFMKDHNVAGLRLSEKLSLDATSRTIVDRVVSGSTKEVQRQRLPELQKRLSVYYSRALEHLDTSLNSAA